MNNAKRLLLPLMGHKEDTKPRAPAGHWRCLESGSSSVKYATGHDGTSDQVLHAVKATGRQRARTGIQKIKKKWCRFFSRLFKCSPCLNKRSVEIINNIEKLEVGKEPNLEQETDPTLEQATELKGEEGKVSTDESFIVISEDPESLVVKEAFINRNYLEQGTKPTVEEGKVSPNESFLVISKDPESPVVKETFINWNYLDEKDVLTVHNFISLWNEKYGTRGETFGTDREINTLMCQNNGEAQICLPKHVLDRGGFGTVRLGLMTHVGKKFTHSLMAVKTINFAGRGEGVQDMIANEVEALLMCGEHENIVQVSFVSFTPTQFYLGMEYAENGCLADWLSKFGGVLEDTARFWFKDIAEAVLFCHTKGVVHLDIKPDNILITGKGDVKLADFGLALIVNNPSEAESFQLFGDKRGTLDYMAPEMDAKAVYDLRLCDVWSLGIVLYMMIAGHHIFGFNYITLVDAWNGRIHFPDDFPPDPRSVIEMALVADPNQRSSLSDILDHPWVNGEYIV